jgi:hypothetical protein
LPVANLCARSSFTYAFLLKVFVTQTNQPRENAGEYDNPALSDNQ